MNTTTVSKSSLVEDVCTPNSFRMKKFKEVIRVEITVDEIAQELLDTLPKDYKHREVVAEAIIATANKSSNLMYIWRAMHGYLPEINFAEGDKIICTETERRVNEWEIVKTTGSETSEELQVMKPKFKDSNNEEIGECEVIEVDYYRSDKIKVRFRQDSYKSEGTEDKEVWVNHLQCSKISQQSEVQVVK